MPLTSILLRPPPAPLPHHQLLLSRLGRQLFLQIRYISIDSGARTIVFASSSSTQVDTTITYSVAMVSNDLKRPTLGITDLRYTISNYIYLYLKMGSYSTTSMTFRTSVNSSSALSNVQITYLALDNSF